MRGEDAHKRAHRYFDAFVSVLNAQVLADDAPPSVKRALTEAYEQLLKHTQKQWEQCEEVEGDERVRQWLFPAGKQTAPAT